VWWLLLAGLVAAGEVFTADGTHLKMSAVSFYDQGAAAYGRCETEYRVKEVTKEAPTCGQQV
jgi:hypothetical protein